MIDTIFEVTPVNKRSAIIAQILDEIEGPISACE